MTITRNHVQKWLDAGNSHDPLQLVSIEGDDAASREHVTGTMTGPHTDPDPATEEVIAPGGKSFDLRAAMHLKYDPSGKIKEVRIFWDRLDFMKQPGSLH